MAALQGVQRPLQDRQETQDGGGWGLEQPALRGPSGAASGQTQAQRHDGTELLSQGAAAHLSRGTRHMSAGLFLLFKGKLNTKTTFFS